LPAVAINGQKGINTDNDTNKENRYREIGMIDPTANAFLAANPGFHLNKMSDSDFYIGFTKTLGIDYFPYGEYYCTKEVTKGQLGKQQCGRCLDGYGLHCLDHPGLRATPHARYLHVFRTMIQQLAPDCHVSSNEPHYSDYLQRRGPTKSQLLKAALNIPENEIDFIDPATESQTKYRSDILIQGGSLCHSKPILIDITIVHPTANYIKKYDKPGSAASQAEELKLSKLKKQFITEGQTNAEIIMFGIETYGAIGPNGRKFLRRLCEGKDPIVLQRLYQTLSVAAHQATGWQVRRIAHFMASKSRVGVTPYGVPPKASSPHTLQLSALNSSQRGQG